MPVFDAQGREIRVNDIVDMGNGRLLQVKGWANVSDPTVRGVHVAAGLTTLVASAPTDAAAQMPIGEQTILWGLEPPPPPPPT